MPTSGAKKGYANPVKPGRIGRRSTLRGMKAVPGIPGVKFGFSKLSSKTTAKASKTAVPDAAGKQFIAELNGLTAALKAGGLPAVKGKLTARKVARVVFDTPALSGVDVAAIRAAVGTSQVIFAALLGVSPNTVRAWEQGTNTPSGIAARFLAEIRDNADRYRKQLVEAMSEA